MLVKVVNKAGERREALEKTRASKTVDSWQAS
jgi:hypothetical protein